MEDSEKLTMLRTLISGDEVVPDEDTLTTYLKIAAKEIMSWRYSYGTAPEELPEEFDMTQIYAVLAGLTTSGAEGETSHSENGINRVFRHVDMLAYIRANVRPLCKVV